MPSLLTLPANLRATILELALTYDTPLSLNDIYPGYHGEGATATLTRAYLAPTQISRQLRRETLPLFYASNTFAICLQPVYVKYTGTRKGKRTEIFRRTYGDAITASWFATLPEEGLREVKSLRVYVACVTRWDPEGDEAFMEREKFRAYSVGEGTAGTGRVTEHMLYDMCSGSQLFYELDLEAESVEGFVEVCDEDDGREENWAGTECAVCMGVLQRWVDSVDEGVDEDEDEDMGMDGEKRVTREKLVELVW
jgi:hypothetical protein